MATARFFLFRLARRRVGIPLVLNVLPPSPPQKPEPLVCIGHLHPWSTSRAMRVGEGLLKDQVRIRILVLSWLALAYVDFKVLITVRTIRSSPAQNTGLRMAPLRLAAITTPPKFRKERCAVCISLPSRQP